jgi:hypothetical protein
MMGQDMKEITGNDPVDVKLSASNPRKISVSLSLPVSATGDFD